MARVLLFGANAKARAAELQENGVKGDSITSETITEFTKPDWYKVHNSNDYFQQQFPFLFLTRL